MILMTVALRIPIPSPLLTARRNGSSFRPMTDPIRPISQILEDASDGDQAAADELMPLVYEELRSMAGFMMSRERSDHTLQPTALVHEAFLRLAPGAEVDWKGRAHFAATAARAMRRILVNHARDRGTDKRGGGWKRLTLDQGMRLDARDDIEFLALEEALGRLTEMNETAGRVLELRFYGGLTIAEAAHVLDVSTTTVENHWALARAWLARELSDRKST